MHKGNRTSIRHVQTNASTVMQYRQQRPAWSDDLSAGAKERRGVARCVMQPDCAWKGARAAAHDVSGPIPVGTTGNARHAQKVNAVRQ